MHHTSSLARRLLALLDSFADLTGRLLAWLVLAMMLAMCAVVALRYGFGIGQQALQESVTYLHASVFLLGSAYALKQSAHVRVDVFYRRFSEQQKAWVNAVGGLVFLLPLCGLILWSSWEFAANAWAIREVSPEPGGIPAVFLLKSLIPLMAIFLALQAIAEILRSSLILLAGGEHD